MYPSLFKNCNDLVIVFQILNISDSITQDVAQCFIKVADADKEVTLLSLARAIIAIRPSYNLKEVANYLQSYIIEKYGDINYDQVYSWLSKKW